MDPEGEILMPPVPDASIATQLAELLGDRHDGARFLVAPYLDGITIPIFRGCLMQLVYRRTDRRTGDDAVVFSCL